MADCLVIAKDKPFTLWSLHDFVCILIVINYAKSKPLTSHWAPACWTSERLTLELNSHEAVCNFFLKFRL